MIEAREAVSILSLLAKGIDPFTGFSLPKDGPLFHPDTILSLEKAIKELEKAKNYEEKIENLPKNIGKAWCKAEEGTLKKLFKDGNDIDEIAKELERTKNSVRNKLFQLGELNLFQETK